MTIINDLLSLNLSDCEWLEWLVAIHETQDST